MSNTQEELRALSAKVTKNYLLSALIAIVAFWALHRSGDATEVAEVAADPLLLEVSRLEVVDQEGKMRLSIDATRDGTCGIYLYDPTEERRASLCVDETGESSLTLGGGRSGGSITLVAAPDHDGFSTLSINSGPVLTGVSAGIKGSRPFLTVRHGSRSEFQVGALDGTELRIDLRDMGSNLVWSTHPDSD